MRKLIAIVVILLGGCGYSARGFHESLKVPDGQAIAATVDDLAVTGVLRVGTTVQVQFGWEGARLVQDGRPSPVLLYELPNLDGPHELTVVSRPWQNDYDANLLVYPRVQLLDAKRATMREVPIDRFVYRQGLRATIFLNADDATARYALIPIHRHPGPIAVKRQAIDVRPNSSIRATDLGHLVLEFRRYDPERVGAR